MLRGDLLIGILHVVLKLRSGHVLSLIGFERMCWLPFGLLFDDGLGELRGYVARV